MEFQTYHIMVLNYHLEHKVEDIFMSTKEHNI